MKKVWFITGSSGGLGYALARTLLEAGERVVASARDTRSLSMQGLTDQFTEQVLLLTLDVINLDSIKDAVSQAVHHFGRIDVLVNNAGFGVIGTTEAFTDEQVKTQLDTNLYAPIELTRAVIPYMREQGFGHILQISSIGGRVASSGLSIYQAAKFGLSGFAEALHKKVSTLGITVVAVEPGGIKTDWGGVSMTYTDEIENSGYETVNNRAAFFKRGGFQPSGDPKKMARVIMDLVERPAPPVHLALGSDTVGILQNGCSVREKELKEWLHVSLSTEVVPADGEVKFLNTKKGEI